MNRFFRASILFLALFLSVSFLGALEVSTGFSYETDSSGAYGDWLVNGGRLYQNDSEQLLAKANFYAPQKGVMDYRFTVRYEGGGVEDKKGGFGIQVFVDKAHNTRSWGNGKSILLWLNYDKDAQYGGSGFRAQVYKSASNTDMQLLEDFDIALDENLLREDYLKLDIPVHIQIDSLNQQVRVWDPRDNTRSFSFPLEELPVKGNFISLRTNSLSLSFDDLSVKRIG